MDFSRCDDHTYTHSCYGVGELVVCGGPSVGQELLLPYEHAGLLETLQLQAQPEQIYYFKLSRLFTVHEMLFSRS